MSASGARRMSMAARSSFAENGNEAPPKTMTSIEETGYLLLEDCLLTVIRNDDNNSNEDYCRRLPPRYRQKWIHVNQSSQKQNIPAAEIEPRTTGGGTDPLCRRCQLVLNMGQPTKKDDDSNSNEECILDLCWDNIPPFQGTLLDSTSTAVCQSSSLHQEECSSSSSSHVRIQQRSDAALLAGLLVACSTQVSVVQCLVFFRQEDEAQPHQQHERASLLFTLAFPHLSTLSSSSSNVTSMSPQQQSIPPSSKAPRSIMGHGRISKKPLYPALQLLLTLVRSDWSRLTAFQQQQQRLPLEASQKSLLPKNPSFFPSKLTLGDVYERIPRSSCDVDPWRVGNNVSTTRTDPSYPLSLTMLPTELLVDKIAPFLKASSLAMLRSTSCFLNWSLRGVVPGLKLRLYKHQVNSLSWMRRRELSLIQSEADCFKTSTSSLFDSISYDGDPHRAITGGATVRLASRPDDQNQINYSIHLDTLTGRSIDLDEPACGEGNLPRRVARGGLLCDDPGLGKTVTVLALILQTCGRASSSTDDQADPAFSTQASDANESLVCGHQNEQNYFSNSDEEQNDDDAIFNAYWAERFVAEFRRPALLKLVNGLHRRNAWGGSFPLEAVQKDIMANNFGPNFSDFELSME